MKKIGNAATYEREHYRLPDGGTTTSARRYVREWRAFGRPLQRALGAKPYAFDPGVSVLMDGHVERFSNAVVRKLNAALGQCKP